MDVIPPSSVHTHKHAHDQTKHTQGHDKRQKKFKNATKSRIHRDFVTNIFFTPTANLGGYTAVGRKETYSERFDLRVEGCGIGLPPTPTPHCLYRKHDREKLAAFPH